MTLVAGVDSSTQGCKLVIVDSQTGNTIRASRAPHPPGTEVDPEAWWSALLECIDKINGIGDVAAISISGQQHGLIALDKNGNVVRPALLWNDTRSASSAGALITEIGGPQVYAKRVGIVPVSSFTASKLRWLRDNEPENANKVAAVALPHDWLTWRLRGFGPENPDLEALVTDRSDASGTAYWSGEIGMYDPQLFFHAFGREMRVAGTPNTTPAAVIVPRVLEPGEQAGLASNGEDGKTVVGAGTGDNAGGALGLGVVDGDVVVSLGTSGAVFSSKRSSLGAGDPSGVVAGFSSASGEHLPLVCTLNGARILESAANMLGLGNDMDNLVPLALSGEPGSGGVVLLPYFEGERTPNLPTAKASIHNLTLLNATASNLARAHVEGLLCSMAQAINAINVTAEDHQDDNASRRIMLIGGAAANRAVQEIAATIFETEEIIIPVPGEYVARGAAVQAYWALTGTKPEWDFPVDRVLPSDYHPEVLEQYTRVQLQEHPQLVPRT